MPQPSPNTMVNLVASLSPRDQLPLLFEACAAWVLSTYLPWLSFSIGFYDAFSENEQPQIDAPPLPSNVIPFPRRQFLVPNHLCPVKATSSSDHKRYTW
jgi:hypothetical protein